jgi:hypothetical protein
MGIICDGAPGQIRPGIPRGMGCAAVATPRDASQRAASRRRNRSRSTNDARFIVRDHSAYVKFSDTGKSIAPGPDAYKDSDLPQWQAVVFSPPLSFLSMILADGLP